MPPPDPRSRTRSPSRRSATAVGLPQPSEARTAASGSSARSRAEYSSAPIVSGSPEQQPPELAWVAAAAYRMRTSSWIDSIVIVGLLNSWRVRGGGRG